MPRQNTCPADFPPFILSQIEQVAQQIVATRKARGETQAQWAQRLGISQPTMARLERGDPAIATATYVMCLWLVNPQLDLRQLLPSALPAAPPAQAATATAPAQAPSPSAADELADLLASWNTPAL
ncbi:helix-turn-helix transcriptional regulator [Comamonas aquatica]|uniref:helix-turn-helix domain-containing protein n=1 Tax=Comamonas aquatica TaxID=225991 RepID=UPI0024477653|nr:helix-turn-helix transcriptional regulator [Comamonas aquatica]MDH1901886.1 helix-turn-helix domain-containing protein [Comamonas aquatica]